MKTEFLYILYKNLPKSLKKYLSESKFLKIFRDYLIRDDSGFSRNLTKKIYYKVSPLKEVGIILTAPPKMIVKAEKYGIENKITRDIYSHCSLLKQGIIVDVGANYGFLSLVWASSMPSLTVHSYEVHPSIYKTLTESVKLNGLKNLTVINKAISSNKQELIFNLGGNTATFDMNHQNSQSKTLKIEATPLDSIYLEENIPPVVAIKIDTDGSDYEVLLGAKTLINTYKPFIVIETNNDPNIIEFLLDAGYTVRDMEYKLILSLASVDWESPAAGNVFASFDVALS